MISTAALDSGLRRSDEAFAVIPRLPTFDFRLSTFDLRPTSFDLRLGTPNGQPIADRMNRGQNSWGESDQVGQIRGGRGRVGSRMRVGVGRPVGDAR